MQFLGGRGWEKEVFGMERGGQAAGGGAAEGRLETLSRDDGCGPPGMKGPLSN